MHNHPLDSKALGQEVIAELDQICNSENPDKPAKIKKKLEMKHKKEISYAQIAYEMAKRRNKDHSAGSEKVSKTRDGRDHELQLLDQNSSSNSDSKS